MTLFPDRRYPRAVYAGSFDPITRGHLEIAQRAAFLFGGVTVLVAVNPDKKTMFTPEERAWLIRDSLPWMEGRQVRVAHTTGYVADWCREHGCDVLVRGIRNGSELAQEMEIARFNRARTGIDTVVLPASFDLQYTSSSRLKDLVRHEVEGLQPEHAEDRAARLAEHATPVVLEAVRARARDPLAPL